MELTIDQIRFIQTKMKARECPYCKSTKKRETTLVELPLLLCLKRPVPINKIIGKAEDIAAVAAECPDCAYLMLFNIKSLLEIKEESSM